MKKELGQGAIISSFTPITVEEAQKFIAVSYEMAKAMHPELPEEPKLVFTVGWYHTSEEDAPTVWVETNKQ
jgi:hypothetical protein